MNKNTKCRVLVVDDDFDIRETLHDVLTDEGFSVDAAENGQDALTYLEAHDAPCVIVLDLMMPVMTGHEFRARQLNDPRFAGIPVIVLSAAGRGTAVVEQLHASAFLGKPTNVNVLLQEVSRHC